MLRVITKFLHYIDTIKIFRMHLDLDTDRRFGLAYKTNTMVEKEKCVSIGE